MISDPVEQVEQRIAEARREFAADVDALLASEDLRRLFSCLVRDRDGGSDAEAVLAVRRFVRDKFDQRLSLRPLGDVVLLQLVREAYDVLNNPQSSVDVRDWTRIASPFLRAE